MSSQELVFSPKKNTPPHEGRRSFVQKYMARWSDDEFGQALDMCDQIMQKRPLADTVCMIAAAAHQEAANIPRALSQYAGQIGARPFTVVVGLNCPTDAANTPAVAASIDAVEKAKKDHPDLDIRSTFKTYDEPKIGQIRRDIWNGVILVALAEDTLSRGSHEVLGIDHGIDLQHLPKGYIRTVQRHYDALIPTQTQWYTPVRATKLRHGASAEHPNISRALYWNDWLLHKNNQSYEAGMVIPMSFYAMQGGHSADRTSYETIGLLKRNGHTPWPSHIPMQQALITSPRRFVEHLPEKGFDVWGDAASFGPNDRYRERDDFPDIETEQMIDLIIKRGDKLDTVAQSIAMQVYKEMAPAPLEGELLSATSSDLTARVYGRIACLAAESQMLLTDILDLPDLGTAMARSLEPQYVDDTVSAVLTEAEKEARHTREAFAIEAKIRRAGTLKPLVPVRPPLLPSLP
jgi:hypothetical protein